MNAQAHTTIGTVFASKKPWSIEQGTTTALKVATRSVFVAIVIGQLIFAFAVASYYGSAVLRGTSAAAWSKHITHGYVPGDPVGNFAVAAHLFSAGVIILAGLIQLIPYIRSRFPRIHRWNGRIYIATAFSLSLAGLYMTWIRGSVGDFIQHIANSILAILIMLCAVMTLRYAMARDFQTHRRWALRLYMVVSASLFIRVGVFLWLLINRGPSGFDPSTFSGPFLTFIGFAQFLVPLAVLELYLRAKERPGAFRRMVTAGILFLLSLLIAAGVFAVSMGAWLPEVKAAYDSRQSIATALASTISSTGIDAAVQQYHDLKATQPSTYNFDEGELNSLGYELLNAKKVNEAIRIFQLNVEAYPKSSNVYDSLGEAYMDGGDRTRAIANYQQSLQLNPKNGNAIKMLQKLGIR